MKKFKYYLLSFHYIHYIDTLLSMIKHIIFRKLIILKKISIKRHLIVHVCVCEIPILDIILKFSINYNMQYRSFSNQYNRQYTRIYRVSHFKTIHYNISETLR